MISEVLSSKVKHEHFHQQHIGALGQYSMHSLCQEGASYAFSIGVPEERICREGCWKSNAWSHYVTHQDLANLSSILGI